MGENLNKNWKVFDINETIQIKIEVFLVVSWKSLLNIKKEIKKQRQNSARFSKKSIKIWNVRENSVIYIRKSQLKFDL